MNCSRQLLQFSTLKAVIEYFFIVSAFISIPYLLSFYYIFLWLFRLFFSFLRCIYDGCLKSLLTPVSGLPRGFL
jgi:hypothetical protein